MLRHGVPDLTGIRNTRRMESKISLHPSRILVLVHLEWAGPSGIALGSGLGIAAKADFDKPQNIFQGKDDSDLPDYYASEDDDPYLDQLARDRLQALENKSYALYKKSLIVDGTDCDNIGAEFSDTEIEWLKNVNTTRSPHIRSFVPVHSWKIWIEGIFIAKY